MLKLNSRQMIQVLNYGLSGLFWLLTDSWIKLFEGWRDILFASEFQDSLQPMLLCFLPAVRATHVVAKASVLLFAEFSKQF